jgi:hypothetical protein
MENIITTPPPVMFDLATFEDMQTADVRIKHPATGAPTAITITLAGPEHPTRRAREMARQRKMRAQLSRTGKIQMGDPEEDLADEAEEMADCTLGWSGLALNGQPLAHSRAAALQLYTDPKRQWLRAQVRAALADRENFIASSATA